MAGTGGGGPIVAAPTTTTLTRTRYVDSSGVVPAGAWCVKIINAGAFDALVLGTILPKSVTADPAIGGTFTKFQGYWDNETNEFVRLPAIAWDCSTLGTGNPGTLIIEVTL